MTTAFVTGITGQDGTILAGRLAAEGVAVHGLVRSREEADEHRALVPAAVEYHVGELTDQERVTALVRSIAPDEVYNLAGISSVAFSWEQPVLTGEVSGLGAVGVFEAAWRAQEESGTAVRIVQASSAEIFGAPDKEPQDEATAVRPVNPYGAAKAYAHEMASIYRSRGLHVSSCILFNHESPLRPTTFVTRKITAAAARIGHDGGGMIRLGNLDARRDWGWAEDYVDAMVRAVRHEGADDFVIATGQVHSVAEFAEAALRRAGLGDTWRDHIEIDPAFLRPTDAAVQVGDATKARTQLGWDVTVDFAEIVGRMVDHDMELLQRTAR